MNKKFSTLLAGFLLAGGLFSTANAEHLTEVEKGVYYTIKQTANWDPTNGWAAPYTGVTAEYHWYYNEELKQVELVNEVPEGKEANAYWTIAPVDGKEGYYTVVDKAGHKFAVAYGDGVVSEFKLAADVANDQTTKVTALSFAGANNETLYVACAEVNSHHVLSTATDKARGFDAAYIPGEAYTAAELNAFNGTGAGFNMTIGYLKDNDANKFTAYSLEGQVFDGTLKASTETVNNVTPDEGFYFLKKGDNFIVLTNTRWSAFNTNHATESMGYKFAVYTKDNLVKQLKKDAIESDATKRVIKATNFQISKNVNDGKYIEVRTDEGSEVYVANFNGKDYLT